MKMFLYLTRGRQIVDFRQLLQMHQRRILADAIQFKMLTKTQYSVQTKMFVK